MHKTSTHNKACVLPDQEEFLDYKGVCALLKIPYGRARNLKSQGKLTYTSFNGKILFSKKAILKELKRNTVKSTDTMLEEISDKN